MNDSKKNNEGGGGNFFLLSFFLKSTFIFFFSELKNSYLEKYNFNILKINLIIYNNYGSIVSYKFNFMVSKLFYITIL